MSRTLGSGMDVTESVDGGPYYRWLFATSTRRAIVLGALLQVLAMAAYYAVVPELDWRVVPLGFVGGIAGAALGNTRHGLWVEGTGAAVLGCCVFLVGYVGWGGVQALGLEGIYAWRLVGVYIALAITQSIMLVPAYAVAGVLSGVVVGWLKRSRQSVPIGRK